VVRSVLFEYTKVLHDVSLEEMIVFKDYSVNRAGEMKHVSEYSRDEFTNARDRRNKRRTEAEKNINVKREAV
jgi:mannose-1-phosphate guanylyltransferase